MSRKRAAVVSVLLAVCVWSLAGQEPASSSAAAQGWEGLYFNPAAVALQRYQAVGLSAGFQADGSSAQAGAFGLSLLDSLHLEYTAAHAAEPETLLARYALGFPLVFPVHAGFGLSADLLDFAWDEVQLSAGLLAHPARCMSLALVAQALQDPAARSYTAGAALRPLGGGERLTLFGDLLVREARGWSAAALDGAVGLRVEPVAGLELGLRVSDRFSRYQGQLDLHMGLTSLGAFWDYEEPSEHRFGARVDLALQPRRSALRFGPRTVQILLTRPLERGSTDAQSPENVDNLVAALHRLAADRHCRTVVLRFDGSIILAPDVLEEVLRALEGIRASGKTLLAYIDSSFSPFDYLAAAAADTLVVSPYSMLPLVGVGAQMLFFKGLFDRLGIDVEYVRSSDYKAALDTFLREGLSDENRRQLEEYLGEVHGLMVRSLASSRGMEAARASELIGGGPYWCEEAVGLGLVDEVLYAQDFEEKYLPDGSAALCLQAYQGRGWRRPTIAVVKAQGPITSAQNAGPWQQLLGSGAITEKTLIPLLEGLARDRRVAGVVLQVDSSGGDGLVSDRIWKSIRTLAEDKPVACVMGAVAASGGYYLAMAGERTFTHRTTLTGSIGSYIAKPVVSRLLERYGVTVDSVELGENVGIFSPFSALTPEQRQRLESLNEAFGRRFYHRVAESRSLSPERVAELGGGRIYSGARAVELDLADAVGGVSEALGWMEDRLGLPEQGYEVRYLPDWRAMLRLAMAGLEHSGLGSRRLPGVLRRIGPGSRR